MKNKTLNIQVKGKTFGISVVQRDCNEIVIWIPVVFLWVMFFDCMQNK